MIIMTSFRTNTYLEMQTYVHLTDMQLGHIAYLTGTACIYKKLICVIVIVWISAYFLLLLLITPDLVVMAPWPTARNKSSIKKRILEVKSILSRRRVSADCSPATGTTKVAISARYAFLQEKEEWENLKRTTCRLIRISLDGSTCWHVDLERKISEFHRIKDRQIGADIQDRNPES